MNSPETPALLVFIAFQYIWIAWGYTKTGQPGMGLAFLCYAGANIGFVWDKLKWGTA